MLLVPRQLLRSGMTGDVAYYGGRLSPAQAYAASRPSPRPPAAPAPPPPSAAPRQPVQVRGAGDTLAALQHLLDTGVITDDEYRRLRERVPR